MTSLKAIIGADHMHCVSKLLHLPIAIGRGRECRAHFSEVMRVSLWITRASLILSRARAVVGGHHVLAASEAMRSILRTAIIYTII